MEEGVKRLRDLWKRANEAGYEVSMAKARADKALAELFEAEAQECARRHVPNGFAIDVLGDGTVKPADQCSRVLVGD